MVTDPNIEVLDDDFLKILCPDSRVETIAEGLNFTEGPVWMKDEGCLLFSDIPEDTMYRWTEVDGLSVFRKPSHNTNGNTTDLEGRLLSCQHGTRTLTRTEKDGSVITLASEFGGKKLNSPNDVVVKSDGTIWFTDPPYGIKKDQIEQPANQVFRLDPATGEMTMVLDSLGMPNGLCFSPDERLLYVADSWHRHDPKIHVLSMSCRGALESDDVFARVPKGVPDGMRVDQDGRLYSTSGEGVCVYAPDGRLLGKIKTMQTAANCTFGGPDGRTLFITASNNVHKVKLAVHGASEPCERD
jgi:gluconolactonase